MAKIIPFPRQHDRASQLVEEVLEKRLGDRSPEVLRCLKGEMSQLVEKYFPGDESAISLTLPNDLTEEQFRVIEKNFRDAFQEHNEKMLRQSNRLFIDLCLSRMLICELRHPQLEE